MDLIRFTAETPTRNPELPHGGRAVAGTAAGLGLATLAAAAWSRLEKGTWNINAMTTRRARTAIAVGALAAAGVGAVAGARENTRWRAFVGTSLGVATSQIPLIFDPDYVDRHPVIGNLWQYGLPIAGTLLGVNLGDRG